MSCDDKEWKISVGALIASKEGTYLLVRPTYKPYWDLPGGILDAGENPKEGLKRELIEELGLNSVCVGDVVCVDYIKSDWENHPVLMLIFEVLVPGDVELSPDQVEISEAKFVDSQEMLRLVSPNMRLRILRILGGMRTFGVTPMR